jgi:hypothetical protein
VCRDNRTENCGQNAPCIKIKTGDKDSYRYGLKVKKIPLKQGVSLTVLYVYRTIVRIGLLSPNAFNSFQQQSLA